MHTCMHATYACMCVCVYAVLMREAGDVTILMAAHAHTCKHMHTHACTGARTQPHMHTCTYTARI